MPKPPLPLEIGTHVRFCKRDVHLPLPEKVLDDLHGLDELVGPVVGLSRGDNRGGTFASIKVPNLPYYCVVPESRLVVVADAARVFARGPRRRGTRS